MNLEPGTVVNGRFRIDRAISSGGMGEVYRALDLENANQPVALKRMLLDFVEEDRDLVVRKFEEEVLVLQRLDFPGIPRFVADFVIEGNRCIVMEFIQGTDLESEVRERAALLQERGLPPVQAVETVIQICKIVEYLHALRPHPIIHRDIKPANVIRRGSDGRIYLVDFGLARNVRESEAKQTKTMVGTVGYAPLEQFQGKPEQRSDLYSLAVTLQFLLTAENPIPFQIPPLEKALPGIHPELARIVRTATFTELDLRHASVYDFRRELERVLPQLSETVQAGTQVAAGAVTQAMEEPTSTDPRADWQELLARGGQRQLLEGIHQEASGNDGLDRFGTTDPLANQDLAEFNRAALQTLAKAGLEEDAPSRRGRWWAALIVVAGLACLTGIYSLAVQRLRPAWALKALEPALRETWKVRALAGVFESELGAGLGLTHPFPLGLLEALRPPSQAGILYERTAPVTVKWLRLSLQDLGDTARLLVVTGDRGVLITRQNDHLLAQRAQITGTALGEFASAQTLGAPLPIKGRRVQVRLVPPLQTRLLAVVLTNPGAARQAVVSGLQVE